MLETILEKNNKWARERISEEPAYFLKNAKEQKPDFLWIGCSDSRVSANLVTGLEPGEVFVHRNIANLVHHSDISFLSVLEFAVGTLGVKHVIVCGHYGCGGVKAAMGGAVPGVVGNWIQSIRDVADECAHELGTCKGEDARFDRLCELSVRKQVRNLSRTQVIQSAWASGSDIAIHGWIYDIADGLLRDLECSMKRED